MPVLVTGIKYNINIVAKITTNILSTQTKREIKNCNRDFRTSDGPQTSSVLSLSDIEIFYESCYNARLILPAYTEDFLLNYGDIEESTFLLIKVIYNGNYSNVNESSYDPYYYYEQNTYNINYYYDSDSGTTYPIGRLLLLNGSILNKIGKIYLNNPSDYDVAIDVLQANINLPPTPQPSSAVTISNLYYNDIITNQVDCYYSTGQTGSTEFIISGVVSSIGTGYTNLKYHIPYTTIISLSSDTSKYYIYLGTLTTYYTIKFLTKYDYEQAYCRMIFAYNSYKNNFCIYLTSDCTYKNGVVMDC